MSVIRSEAFLTVLRSESVCADHHADIYLDSRLSAWIQLLTPLHDYAMAIENRGPEVEAVAIAFLTLSWIAVSLRCYVKFFMIKLFRIDDWLMVLSLV